MKHLGMFLIIAGIAAFITPRLSAPECASIDMLTVRAKLSLAGVGRRFSANPEI
jgi:hypothetical protein